MQILSLVFTAALFVAAHNQEQVYKLRQSSIVEYYAAMNKDESILDESPCSSPRYMKKKSRLSDNAHTGDSWTTQGLPPTDPPTTQSKICL